MILLTKENDLATIREICSILDYSMALVPDATTKLVEEACEHAKRYKYAAVPVFPHHIKLVSKLLKGSSVATQLTLGFPCGGTDSRVKAFEAEVGLENGATEIDMVLNIGRLIDKDFNYVENDIRQVVEIAGKKNVGVKVIIEVGFLNDCQKKDAVELIASAGAEFVKTCTGFGPGKATMHDICLLQTRANGRLKVKASGGVLSLEDALGFKQAGASRIAGRLPITEQLESLGIKSIE